MNVGFSRYYFGRAASKLGLKDTSSIRNMKRHESTEVFLVQLPTQFSSSEKSQESRSEQEDTLRPRRAYSLLRRAHAIIVSKFFDWAKSLYRVLVTSSSANIVGGRLGNLDPSRFL
jgi:hypothetical protein